MIRTGLVALSVVAWLFSFMPASAQTQAAIEHVAAQERTLQMRVAGGGQEVRVIELRPYQRVQDAALMPVVWQGKAGGEPIEIARFASERDRLFSRFQLVGAGQGEPLGPAAWVTDLSALVVRDFEFGWNRRGIKGLSCVVRVEDAARLGVNFATDNIWFNQAFDLGADPQDFVEVDGLAVPINLAYFRRVDAKVKAMTDAGINVTMVLNNTLPAHMAPDHPLHHPRNRRAQAPRPHTAINVTNEAGLLWYRALMEFLANRYSDPQSQYGWVSGYIVGNEVQSHWEWYNMGEVDAEDFMDDYVRVLRVTDLAGRKVHARIRIYVSMDHFWNQPMHANALRCLGGRELLEGINARSLAEGNFPWHIAAHPYPEKLRRPESWLDQTATLGFDTPRITYKNIEVLPAFLRHARYLYQGKPRRIILSEQGVNQPDGADGELLQAAGYAYAYYRTSHTPGIDAFMLHRHVDARGEGGLRLGLWSWDQPPRKKRIYDVFRQADAQSWEEAFDFAKAIIGIEQWEELNAKSVPTSP